MVRARSILCRLPLPPTSVAKGNIFSANPFLPRGSSLVPDSTKQQIPTPSQLYQNPVSNVAGPVLKVEESLTRNHLPLSQQFLSNSGITSFRQANVPFQTREYSSKNHPTTDSFKSIWKRCMSNLPESTIYGGPKPQSPWKRITLRHLAAKHARREPIAMMTAYDYPSAVHVDMAGLDILLVGDSVGMVVHGHDTTLPVTMDDMILHCRAVARGASRPLLVGDLPFGSYEQSPEHAVLNAVRLLKEGGMDAVKIEGGNPARVAAARAIVDAGIAVMGHVGLTPQAISSLGGFRPQGRTAAGATQVVEHALALEGAGCFSLVIECTPAPVSAAITAALKIPTIGIGAGPSCSGQVLVYHDLLGMMQHPHHAKVSPKFCRQYANVGEVIQRGLTAYREDVSSGAFPSHEFSPYRIDQSEVAAFGEELRRRGLGGAAEAAVDAAREDEKAGEPKIKTPVD